MEGKLWFTLIQKNAQIDYVLMNQKWSSSALNCETYSSFEEVSSDPKTFVTFLS